MKVHIGTTIRPTDAPRARWLAPERSGIGHAFARGVARSACNGVPAFEERFAWPVTVRCDECLVVVGAEQVRTAPPITESEQRALWGDR